MYEKSGGCKTCGGNKNMPKPKKVDLSKPMQTPIQKLMKSSVPMKKTARGG
jgi:hypothetical protein